jgi:N6-L-threonylcarbamoyladenine synthase
LLGLGYPGGPLIERFAAGGRSDAFDFPKGNGPRGDLSFSFSGLKTSLRYRLEKMSIDEVTAGLPDLCASYQQAVIDSLLRRTRAALALRPWRSLGLSGGVANNGALRQAMSAEAHKAGLEFLAAAPRHTGDNAGMIGFAAWSDVDGTQSAAGYDLSVEPNAPLA